VTITIIGTEIAHPSFDLSSGFNIVVPMLFSIYTVGAFVKAKVQTHKRIQLSVTAQEVQEGSNLLPTQPHRIIVTGYKSVAGRKY
jgi:hypothetical protein